jgi:hypothetical protein
MLQIIEKTGLTEKTHLREAIPSLDGCYLSVSASSEEISKNPLTTETSMRVVCQAVKRIDTYGC